MHQKGKLKPIIVTDADIRRLSYVPREHALRKGSASLARFRTAYCKLFDACDDRGSADAFLLFLRRKLNDKIEKHAQKVCPRLSPALALLCALAHFTRLKIVVFTLSSLSSNAKQRQCGRWRSQRRKS